MDTVPCPEYKATPLWCADVLLKGNRLLGMLSGISASEAQRETLFAYHAELIRMASGHPRNSVLEFDDECDRLCSLANEERRDRQLVTALSQLRRAVNAQLRAAGTRETSDHNNHLSFAAFDWLCAASNDDLDVQLTIPDVSADLPEALGAYPDLIAQANATITTAEDGLKKLRAWLEDLTAHFMEVEITPRAQHAMDTLKNPAVDRLVRGALNMQLLACFFDSARLAAGGRSAHACYPSQDLSADVVRAEEGRTSAYMAMRLYVALEIVVAMMMMGCARKAQDDGNREAWPETPTGKAVLAFRQQVGEVLTAYDSHKREAANLAQRTYTAQTAGYVAALQEQAASLATRAIEGDGALFEAIAMGFGKANVIMPSAAQPVFADASYRTNLWNCIFMLTGHRAESADVPVDRTVVSLHVTMASTVSTLVFHALDPKMKSTVQFSDAMRKAMAEASRQWPPVSSFYGRDYQDTERKVSSKAAREGRDAHGRETGEAFGYRLEWLGYLNGAATRPKTGSTLEGAARESAAVSLMAMSEGLLLDGATRFPIAANGNAIHIVHGASMAMEPSQLYRSHHSGRVDSSFMFDPLDERHKTRMASLESQHQSLEWKVHFAEKVVERVSVPFKAWSGGALATDVYYGFFAEVWKRFNDNLSRDGSPWAEKVRRWLVHYRAGTTPPRANGEAKLIHPWRVMFLQKGVAQGLLQELYAESKVLTARHTRMRTALRVQRSLLSVIISNYDYAPWAAHLIRRFCVADEQRGKRRREDEHEQTVAADSPQPPFAAPGPSSPSLARVAVAPRWNA